MRVLTPVLMIPLTLAANILAADGDLPGSNRPARVVGLQERVACQRAIEEVYWRHRIWPDSNPGPKPSLSSVVSDADLRDKAEDGLSKSRALGAIWERPIRAPQLRAELRHMARGTRHPQMLQELWDALGNDPVLVAECLARPILADRLIRGWYAFDERFHGELRARVGIDVGLHGSVEGMKAMSGEYETQVWRRAKSGAEPAYGPRGSSGDRVLSEEEWIGATENLRGVFALDGQSFTGLPEALPVRTLSPIREDERRIYVLAILDRGPDNLRLATVTWPKRPFDDWWAASRIDFAPALPEENVSTGPLPEIAQGGCAADSWDALPFQPRPRDLHVAVWTGSEMLIWGGDFVEPANVPGGRYEPATDTWRPINSINPPTTRQHATAVWTGTEMIVWGGWGGGTNENVKNTGARYDPITDSWIPTSLSGAVPDARTQHTAVWSGTEMIVWGGCATWGCVQRLNTGGRYSPATDSWSSVETGGAPAERFLHTAIWTGSEMIVWGGEGSGVVHNDGGRYDPAADRWTALTLVGAPDARSLHTAVWTGDRMIVWGGCRSSACFYPIFDSGGVYDPAADTWRPTSTAGAPYQRRYHTAVWTGREMIVWGGCVDSDCSDFRDTGGRYDPVTDTWIPTDTTSDPGARAQHTAVWTGTEMIVWGGCTGGECAIELTGGGRYDPATDSWVPVGAAAPLARIHHTAVWTGAEMIIWGGQNAYPMSDGMRYDLATDRWRTVTRLGAPAARSWHSAVWTGEDMIVWGGVLRFGGSTSTGGRYDPVTDSWQPMSTSGAPSGRSGHTAVWTGTEMMVWGGATTLNTGGRYDPVTDSWIPMSTSGAPSGRFGHTGVWSGEEMIVWGGGTDFFSASATTATGGRYSPATDTWAATTLSGAPGPRRYHSGVWTGAEMIVWGGEGPGGVAGDGARYNPVSDTWTPVSTGSAPAPRHSHIGVWTGTEMIVWGGEDGVTFPLAGGRYEPAGDSWIPTSTGPFTPLGRKLHSAVWTGSEALVWGGQSGSGYPETGAGYCPTGAQILSSPGSVDGLGVTDQGGALELTWNPACSPGATDYAVYVGVIGEWSSLIPYLCSTGGATSATIAPGPGNWYAVVVPLNGQFEGSYGTDSGGAERAPSLSACLAAQSLGSCP